MAKKVSSRKSSSTSGKKASKKVAKKATKKVKKASKKTSRKIAKKIAKKKIVKKSVKAKAPKQVKSAFRKPALEKFRQMLLVKRRALIGDMSGIEAETIGSSRQSSSSELSNMPTHLADLGTDNYEHEFSLGLLESERALLAEIDEALERINQGTYGVCSGTGKPIGKTRLMARPWAKYCIEYARMIEQGLIHPEEEEDEELEE